MLTNFEYKILGNFIQIIIPKGCECTFWKSCRWSHIALPFISINVLPLRYRKRNEHIAAFAKNICNHKDLSVCCCGPEQTSPDYLRPKNLSGKNTIWKISKNLIKNKTENAIFTPTLPAPHIRLNCWEKTTKRNAKKCKDKC